MKKFNAIPFGHLFTLKLVCIFVLIIAFSAISVAQNVAINNSSSPPDSSAILDVAGSDKGLLIPRVALAGLDDTSTIKSAATSLLVYNNATTDDLSPGYYYWNDSIWIKLSTSWKEGDEGIHYMGGNVGIGTKSPDHTFELATEGVATIYLTSYRETGYNAGHFVGRSARGTQASPSSSLLGDFLGVLSAKGHGHTDFGPFNSSDARIALIAAEDFSDTTKGTDIAFFTTPAEQTGMLERVRVDNRGHIGIGTSSPEELLTLRSGNSNIRAYTEHDSEESSLQFMRSKFNENSLDQNGGILGKIDAFGYDGSNYLNSAGIWFTTDGIVNLDTMPGRIEFMTLEEGAEEPSVKMVLKSNGWVGLGTETPSANLQVIGTTQVDSLKISPGASDGYVLTSDASGKAKWKEPSTIGMVPIGTILPWHKNLTGVPSLTDQFVECNGQTISDSESPLNGQSTPDLNTSKRFLRGNTASGAMGGSNTHAHSGNTDNNGSQISINSSGPIPTLNAATVSHSHTYSTPQTEHVPMYFNVVWIMRVK